MKTVTIGIASLDEASARFIKAFEAGQPQGARISFLTPEDLWRTLTLKRWELLKTMAGAGPLTIREVARRLGRDVKAVHGDVQTLLNQGLLDKTTDGKIVFPYDAIHVDFVLEAA